MLLYNASIKRLWLTTGNLFFSRAGECLKSVKDSMPALTWHLLK